MGGGGVFLVEDIIRSSVCLAERDLQCFAERDLQDTGDELQVVAVYCSVVGCCSVLQCVAVCRSVLQCIAVCCVCCRKRPSNTQQHTAIHSNTL